jgi:serine/threonine protein kinase
MSPTEEVPREETSDASGAERVATPPSPTSAENLSGQCVAGRFDVQTLVGNGPIGQVYRALRRADGAPVALKILHEKHRPDPNVVRRFAREAQAAMQLDHPHIARVYEHGVDEAGRPFLCSEWVEGLPLTQAVAAKPPTLRRMLVPICQALSALSEAQRHGVLHRGLKPSNLLAVESGDNELSLKVSDFGMAKLLKPVPGTLSTKYGAPCGAAEYAAPEQAQSGELDGRADVYAMGVVLYELLTGQVPFRGGSDAAVLAKHRSDPAVPPQKLRPDRSIPREIESICLKALAKPLAERYRSPRELGNALHSTLELLGVRADLPIEEPPKPDAQGEQISRLTMPGEQLRSRQKIWLGAGLLLLVCGVVWVSAPREAPQTSANIRLSGVAKTSSAAPGEENAALLEGKRRLAHADAAGAVEQLTLARQQLGETAQVARWLGEALLRAGQPVQGEALLRRYLELDPHAGDREQVEALLASP